MRSDAGFGKQSISLFEFSVSFVGLTIGAPAMEKHYQLYTCNFYTVYPLILITIMIHHLYIFQKLRPSATTHILHTSCMSEWEQWTAEQEVICTIISQTQRDKLKIIS